MASIFFCRRFFTLPWLFIFSLNLPAAGPAPRDYPVKPVPFTAVHLHDVFGAPCLETNRTVTIPYAFGQCQASGRMDNFERAGAVLRSENIANRKPSGFPFDDTNPCKVLEGAAGSRCSGVRLFFMSSGPTTQRAGCQLLLPDDQLLTTRFDPALLDGVQVIEGKACNVATNEPPHAFKRLQDFTAIPYSAWANRRPGEMMVWIPDAESAGRGP